MASIKVNCVHKSVTRDVVESWFRPYGEIASIHIMVCENSPYNYAHVNFAQVESADLVHASKPVFEFGGVSTRISPKKSENNSFSSSSDVLHTSFTSRTSSYMSQNSLSIRGSSGIERVVSGLKTWQVAVVRKYHVAELANTCKEVYRCKFFVSSDTSVTINGQTEFEVANATNVVEEFVKKITMREFSNIRDESSLNSFCTANNCHFLKIFGTYEVYGSKEALDKLQNYLIQDKSSKKQTEGQQTSSEEDEEKLKACKKLFPRAMPEDSLRRIRSIVLKCNEKSIKRFYGNILKGCNEAIHYIESKVDIKVYYKIETAPLFIDLLQTEKPKTHIINADGHSDILKRESDKIVGFGARAGADIEIDKAKGKIKITAWDKDIRLISDRINFFLEDNTIASVEIVLEASDKYKYLFLKQSKTVQALFVDKYKGKFIFSKKIDSERSVFPITIQCPRSKRDEAKQELINVLENIHKKEYPTSFPQKCIALASSFLLENKKRIESMYNNVVLICPSSVEKFKKVKVNDKKVVYSIQVNFLTMNEEVDNQFLTVAKLLSNFTFEEVSISNPNLFENKLAFDESEANVEINAKSISISAINSAVLSGITEQIMKIKAGVTKDIIFIGSPNFIDRKQLISQKLDKQADVRKAVHGFLLSVPHNTAPSSAKLVRDTIHNLGSKVLINTLNVSKEESYIIKCFEGKLITKLMDQYNVEFFFSRPTETEFHCKLETNGHFLEYHFGNIMDSGTEAIVSPANESLQNQGGLAAIIESKGGSSVLKECKSYIDTYGKLETSKCFAGTPGNIGNRFRFIIHTVGPTYNGGNRNEKTILQNTVKNVLQLAEELKIQSISIPPISSGIFNYPIQECVSVIIHEAFLFLKTSTHVKKIVLCDNEEKHKAYWHTEMVDFSKSSNTTIVKNAHINFLQITKPNNQSFLQSSVFFNNGMQYLFRKSPNIQWYWKDDENMWKAYSPKYNDTINSCISNGLQKFALQIGNKSYTIDIKNKTQTNNSSNYVHEISNELPFKLNVQWRWKDDSNQFSAYSAQNSDLIEEAYNTKQSTFTLNIKRHLDDKPQDYLFDFEKMTQQNLKTKYLRDISREEIKQDINPPEQDPTPLEKSKVNAKKSDKKDSMYIAVYGYIQKDLNTCVSEIKEAFSKYIRAADVKFLNAVKYNVEIEKLFEEHGIQNFIIETNVVKFECYENSISDIKADIIGLNNSILSSQSSEDSIYPKDWDLNNPSLLINVTANSTEWNAIQTRIRETLPQASIVSISRIQNKTLWKRYHIEKNKVLEKMSNVSTSGIEKMLFHGTRSCPPAEIYKGEEGFESRVSAPGMWGYGIYFAQNASYSNNYAYTTSTGEKQFFFASVIVGETFRCTSTASTRVYRMPPQKGRNNYGVTEYYDSVSGNTDGSDVFIVYTNTKCYPYYLVTYK